MIFNCSRFLLLLLAVFLTVSCVQQGAHATFCRTHGDESNDCKQNQCYVGTNCTNFDIPMLHDLRGCFTHSISVEIHHITKRCHFTEDQGVFARCEKCRFCASDDHCEIQENNDAEEMSTTTDRKNPTPLVESSTVNGSLAPTASSTSLLQMWMALIALLTGVASIRAQL